MTFRRVLVTTALVAVLASSLFSGWVGGNLSPLKTPIAQAQTARTGDEVKKWMDALTSGQKDMRILVPSDQSSPHPPYIASKTSNFIPADATSGRPELVFELAATSFNHS